MRYIEICENDVRLMFGVDDKERLLLFYVSTRQQDMDRVTTDFSEFSPVEVIVTGGNCPEDRLGHKFVHSSAGVGLRFLNYERMEEENGCRYVFYMQNEEYGLHVELHYCFYDGVQAFTSFSRVTNTGHIPQGLEALTSFSLHGFDVYGRQGYEERYRLHLVHNGWQKELAWSAGSFSQMGLSASQERGRYNSSKMISVTNTGAWSTKEYLPLGFLEDREQGECLAWQIEHNGSWHWEIAEHAGMLYLKVTGPTELYAHWYREIAPGEQFTSVPVSVVCTKGDVRDAAVQLNEYRRRIRRENEDNRTMPVIFNDYMNCLWGKPTTEEEIPLIDMAADMGCEYYCIDCGWYSAGEWWSNVGEWLPSKERFPVTTKFPEGFTSLLKYIRAKGMVPGLWLELEVMGLNCRLAGQKPDSWFFMRHGRRVREKSRYQLDFRNPQVRAFADEVIARLVEEYGVGYIKMDYNIEPGIGTDYEADSPGDGLLEHERAYLAWLAGIFAKYPRLVIENCGSGGMRMDYAMLKLCSIQSTSDMEDYRIYSTIAVNAPIALKPEQAAVWSYPLHAQDEEETIFNMVNVMLLRIHQSGHLFRLGEHCRELIAEAISYYKDTREDRRSACPFWPLGFAAYQDNWACLGLQGADKTYLAVWRRGGDEPDCLLPMPQYRGKEIHIRCAYPAKKEAAFAWDCEEGCLSVTFDRKVMARVFEIE